MDLIKEKPIVKIVMLKGADGNGLKLSEHENDAGFLTREEIITLVNNIIATGEVGDIDTGFVTRLVEQNKKKALKFWVGTTAEYNTLATVNANTFYIITDDTFKPDVLRAIGEINARIDEIEQADIEAELADLQTRVNTLTANNEQLQEALTAAQETVNSMRYTVENPAGTINETIDFLTAGYITAGRDKISFMLPLKKVLPANMRARAVGATLRARYYEVYAVGTADTAQEVSGGKISVQAFPTYINVTITTDAGKDESILTPEARYNNESLGLSGQLTIQLYVTT
jgi:hypothetical protein